MVLQILVECRTSDMASLKTNPIFFGGGAADTLLLSIQIEFRVGLGRREDEITNNINTGFKYRSSILCFNGVS